MSFAHDMEKLLAWWFEEDIREGDHSSLSTIPAHARGTASLLVKQEGILAGVEYARKTFAYFDPELELELLLEDGTEIQKGDLVFHVRGRVRSILQCERLVLNLMQRMSGIATNTREYVKLVEGTGTRILDTRKTTPGFRQAEKDAVRIGGGVNHRFGLFDMIMIKDNHIDFAGGIAPAIRGAQDYLRKNNLSLKIEVETRSLEDIREVLEIGGIDRIMLDNFSPGLTLEAVRLIDGRFETESSGGITRESIRSYAECGVDYISVGALTHQVQSLDLSLKADFKT